MGLDLQTCPHCSTPIVPNLDDTCPSCRHNINQELAPDQVMRLQVARETRSETNSDTLQRRLLLLAILATGICIVPFIALLRGASAFVVAIVFFESAVFGVFLFAWAFAYAYAPVATKRITALLVIGSLLFSLLACWLIHTRELARRNDVRNRLKKQGLEIHEKYEHQPDAVQSVIQNWD